MDKFFYDILNDINEGIIILNNKFEIYFWNNFMENITDNCSENVIGNNIFSVLPKVDTNYFRMSLKDVLTNGNKTFLCAAMHKNLISTKVDLNINISRLSKDNLQFLILEFIDVTNQFIQIGKLKKNINELVSLNKKLQEKEKIIENLAYYDNLTGVANRTLFYKLSETLLENAKRNNSKFCILFLDVDNFKYINDTYNHEAGDKVIVRVAKILRESTRKVDIVARYGGDEFLILLPNLKKYSDCRLIISKIVNKNNLLNVNGNNIKISLSTGISFFPKDGKNIDKLISTADKRMYIAKKRRHKNLKG